MSETIKNSGEAGRGEETGWEELEAMPKHMGEGEPRESHNEDYEPRHMKKEVPELSEKDQKRLEAWQATIQKLRAERANASAATVEDEEVDEEIDATDGGVEVDEMTVSDEEVDMTDTGEAKSEEEATKKYDPLPRLREKAVRPEEIGTTAEELLRTQAGLMIDQKIEDGDSGFWVNSADRDGEPFETTLNQELEKYREQITNARNMTELSRATRIENNVQFALGGNEEVMEQFKKIAEETGYREKQKAFSGDSTRYEKKTVDAAVTDISKQVTEIEKELEIIQSGLSKYRGMKGLFGKGRIEKEQLRWQYDQSKRRLERLQGDLRELGERSANLEEKIQSEPSLRVVPGDREPEGDAGKLEKAA